MSINDKILKATSDELSKEDWGAIIAACEAILAAPKSSQSQALQTIRSRIESSAGNTQLYSMTLLNVLAQSGSSEITSFIASSETRKSLDKVAGASDRGVREQANNVMDSLAEAVKTAEFTAFTTQWKQRNSESSRVAKSSDEDEQFQRALRLSMQDQPKVVRKSVPAPSAESVSSNNEIMQKINKPMPPTPREIRRVKALYEYSSTTMGDLSFKPGQVITIIENNHKDWWKGTLDGKVGIFPANYVEYIREKTPTTEEEYIFAQAPNVEKLLSIFASASQHPGYSIVGNQDIESMYHEVLALRPQLIRMIDEYGARKQKLMQLNRDVVDARQQYESLLSARMSGPSTAGMHQYSSVPSPGRPRQEYPMAGGQQAQQSLQSSLPLQHHPAAPGTAPDYPPAYPQQYGYPPVDRPTNTHDAGYPGQRRSSHANVAASHRSYSASSAEHPAEPTQNPGPPYRLPATTVESPIQMPASPGYTPGTHTRTTSNPNSVSSLPYPA